MIEKVFINEHGNQIRMSVSASDSEVVIFASGPDSVVHHTWTRVEALALLGLLLGTLTKPPYTG